MRLCIFLFLLTLLIALPANGYASDGRSTSVVTIAGDRYYVHTVQGGETVYSLTTLYQVSEKELSRDNPQIINGLEKGQVLKVIVKQRREERVSGKRKNRLFDTHTVSQGETLYSISRRYEISVSTLLEDNQYLDPAHLAIGQEIDIRKKSIGESSAEQIGEQITEYKDAVNSISTELKYHLVERGETLFGLSRMYDVTEQQIIDANSGYTGLKTGAMVIIPILSPQTDGGEAKDTTIYVVGGEQRADSLTRLGLSVAELVGSMPIDISMLLPLTDGAGAGNKNYLEFYQGVLLALEDLKNEGVSANMSLYNTSRSESDDVMRSIVESDEFAATDLIIGPVYEQNIGCVLAFAERNRVAVISPLAAMDGVSSPMLYQMAPGAKSKYTKLKELFTEDKTIIFVTTEDKDTEMEQELKPLLPNGYSTINYTGDVKVDPFEGVINRRGENLIIISCTNELVVDQLLAVISSKQNNLKARSMSNGDISIVGGARWARFQSYIDKNLYFKLRLCYPTSYHADRSDKRVQSFDRRYIANYRTIPTFYSYRGYDAAKLFVGSAMRSGADFTEKLNNATEQLLQVEYNFIQNGAGENYVNDNWMLVQYNSNYTVEVR